MNKLEQHFAKDEAVSTAATAGDAGERDALRRLAAHEQTVRSNGANGDWRAATQLLDALGAAYLRTLSGEYHPNGNESRQTSSDAHAAAVDGCSS